VDFNEIVQTITTHALPVLLAITLHEAAHGYVAKLLGDNTAWALGRVTLNPVPHIDLVGTIAIPLVL
jgi:Zn-dependent protease